MPMASIACMLLQAFHRLIIASAFIQPDKRIHTEEKKKKKKNVDANKTSSFFKPTDVIVLYCADGLSGNNAGKILCPNCK